MPGGLFDRPPLAADIELGGLSFTVFSNHFASKGSPNACRDAQAAFVRDRVGEVENTGGQAIIVGDLNAFETESPLDTLQDGRTTLTNQWGEAPEGEAYSFQFQGRLQTLDHALITDGLEPKVDDFLYAHMDNDYYERVTQPTGAPDGHRVSDHDPPVLTLDASRADTTPPSVDPRNPDSGSRVRDRTPEIRAAVKDPETDLRKSDIKLYLDGRRMETFGYDREENVLSHTPNRNLAYGPHALRVVAGDAAGNTASERWGFRVVR